MFLKIIEFFEWVHLNTSIRYRVEQKANVEECLIYKIQKSLKLMIEAGKTRTVDLIIMLKMKAKK